MGCSLWAGLLLPQHRFCDHADLCQLSSEKVRLVQQRIQLQLSRQRVSLVFGRSRSFWALGFLAASQGVDVNSVVNAGVGLAFVVFPQIINQFPGLNSLFGGPPFRVVALRRLYFGHLHSGADHCQCEGEV